jgi:HEPN domain-containing protein
LKALLVSRSELVPKVHDVVLLLERCRACGVELAGLDTDCRWLNQCAVRFRYPGNGPDAAETEAREAVAASRRVVDAVSLLL